MPVLSGCGQEDDGSAVREFGCNWRGIDKQFVHRPARQLGKSAVRLLFEEDAMRMGTLRARAPVIHLH